MSSKTTSGAVARWAPVLRVQTSPRAPRRRKTWPEVGTGGCRAGTADLVRTELRRGRPLEESATPPRTRVALVPERPRQDSNLRPAAEKWLGGRRDCADLRQERYRSSGRKRVSSGECGTRGNSPIVSELAVERPVSNAEPVARGFHPGSLARRCISRRDRHRANRRRHARAMVRRCPSERASTGSVSRQSARSRTPSIRT